MVMSLAEATAWVGRLRATGRRIVFTSGAFDLLHPVHVRYLTGARTHGDVLIVGLKSDRSIQAVNTAGRPINPEAERAEILSALSAVDAVVVYDEDTPATVVSTLCPDVVVEDADLSEDATRFLGKVKAVGK